VPSWQRGTLPPSCSSSANILVNKILPLQNSQHPIVRQCTTLLHSWEVSVLLYIILKECSGTECTFAAWLTYSIQQNPWEANSYLAFHRTCRFITMCTRSCHWILSWARCI
jgi:hypothetical protein